LSIVQARSAPQILRLAKSHAIGGQSRLDPRHPRHTHEEKRQVVDTYLNAPLLLAHL
jgi:hypothetical protein